MEGKSAAGWPSMRLVYYLLFAQLLGQLASFSYLYGHVMRLERELLVRQLSARDAGADIDCRPELASSGGADTLPAQGSTIRRRRSSAIPATEDNAVSEVFRARDDKEGVKESKSAASVKGKDWVWVTGDTRIPADALETFCRKTIEFCPPGYPGLPGAIGPPGDSGSSGPIGPPGSKGDQGLPGIQGTPGMPGPRGAPGPGGSKGEPGLDGIDGIPGEPGLDGLPGRSGNDGLPGQDGKPGLNGTPGAPGRNGTDGRHGMPGPQGPQGPPGIPGKMGLRGLPGQDGKPGAPSIVAYTPFRANASAPYIDPSSILVPPSIAGNLQIQYVVVEEGLNLRLDCFATGSPDPIVQWHRPDGLPIHTGIWHASAIYGKSLNLSSVHRDDTGNYTCTADNGVPPSSSKKIKVSVKFGPLIRVRTPMVRVRGHASVMQLECEVEAYPRPEMHWESRIDGRLDGKTDKYRVQEEEYRRDYKFKMKLKILKMSQPDFGTYYCVARNSINITKGIITISKDTNDKTSLSLSPSSSSPTGVAVFGKLPPPRPQYRNLCPPQLNCDSCPRASCGDAGVVEAKPLTGINFSGMPRGSLVNGVIGAVGIAVFKGKMEDSYGIWMQDASPKSNATAGKLWVTRSSDTSHIYEYNDIEDYTQKKTPRSIKLPYPFQGNGHLVNDGYFFYNPYNHSSIIRLDLTHSEGTMYAYSRLEMELPGLRVNTGNYLYTPNHNFNYVDFDVDENGLWAIYGTPTNGTVVMKVDPERMTTQHAWSISVDHHKYGEMFIARGVLYAVHGVNQPSMNISLAVDLYHGKQLDVHLSFANAYLEVTMLRYNSRTKELYTWNKGSLLAYQVRYGGAELPARDAPAAYASARDDNPDDYYNA